MSHGQGKPQNGQGNVREKSGNFVRAHGWTPCFTLIYCVYVMNSYWIQKIYLVISFMVASRVPRQLKHMPMEITGIWVNLTGAKPHQNITNREPRV